MWRTYLFDTLSGEIDVPIDIPNFSWDLTISSASLSIYSDKGTGKADATGLKIPWEAVPATTVEARNRMLAPYRRSILLCHIGNDGVEIPVIAGLIGKRTDTWLDTSFDMISILDFLSNRIAVRDGVYGKGIGGTTQDNIELYNMSLRGILATVGQICTDGKTGGHLPIDWNYINESGTNQRKYFGYDIQNTTFKDIADKISNSVNGPDVTFRPYFKTKNSIRWSFIAGSESNPYLDEDSAYHTFSMFKGGGDLDKTEIAMATPLMRSYATGSGSDDATLCYLAEDLTLCTQVDPWPLMEESYSLTDDETIPTLEQHSIARLNAAKYPRWQLSGQWNAGDFNTPQPGDIWPGQLVEVSIQDHPSIPDGIYQMRIMEMSGDSTETVKVTFDVLKDTRW